MALSEKADGLDDGAMDGPVSGDGTHASTVVFQQGSDGYAGGVDTYLIESQPLVNSSSSETLEIDSEERRGEVQALLRFDDIFGNGTGQIPSGATILSATLEVQTTTAGDGASLHRMLQPWSDGATWESLANGIQADGIEAMSRSDLDTGQLAAGTTRLDVTTSLQAWADGQANHGWALLPLGPEGWGFDSAQGGAPPRLIVVYDSPAAGEPVDPPTIAADDTTTATEGLALPVEAPGDGSAPEGSPDADADRQASMLTTDASQVTDDDPMLRDEGLITLGLPDDGLTGESTSLSMTASTTSAPIIATSQFQQGRSGYAGAVDTYLYEGQSRANRGTQKTLTVDSDDRRGEVQSLLRFDDIFGNGTGQVPSGATILSATLEVQTTTAGDGASLHRMLQPWSDGATWDSLANGIQADGIEAMSRSDLDTGAIPAGTTRLDVTTSLQAWADGQANHGWAFLPLGPDGWRFDSAEGGAPPRLIVEYSFEGGEPVNRPPLASDDSATTLEGTAVRIAVLDNDSDPDGDALRVGEATQPANGTLAINADGTITYTPAAGFVGSDSFTYRADDGTLLSDPATVSLTVEAQQEPPDPRTTVQFQHGSGGYAGGVDTYLHQAQPGTSRATATTLNVDSADNGGAVQALLRFDAIFGSGAGQVPLGATILSATLEVQTTGKGDGAKLHRMLQPWSDGATWESLANGIQADGIEAMSRSDLETGAIPAGTTRLDVTPSLQAWADGQLNLGWALLPRGSDGWDFGSAENSAPPRLIVEYSLPDNAPPNTAPLASDDSATTPQGGAVEIAVLANDSDPEGDPLALGELTAPAHGILRVMPDGSLLYTPDRYFTGEDSFTYRASDGHLLSGVATVSLTVTPSDDPPPLPLETSYIATAFSTSDTRNFEHTNATKSFYHDGEWWSVLPEATGWHVYRFDGTLPDPGSMGGWIESSPAMLSSGRRADIAWDDATDTLYVLNFGPSEAQPRLFQLTYNALSQTFEIDANIPLAGQGGRLTGAEWQRNSEMGLGLDQNGHPVVSLIGPSAAGGESGLKLAFPLAGDLASWATALIDSGPTTDSAGNGDNKVDFVAFQRGGVDHVGLVYGDAATGLWKFAFKETLASPAGYGSGWTIDTITDAVVLDDHVAALWDGSSILMTMKDDQDALWAIKGLPGDWDAPVLVHAATHSSSRPTLAYDEDNQTLFVFYQENTNPPFGDIYVKASDVATLAFDAGDPGTLFLTSTRADENMSDPQMPTHSVGEATDGMFFVFARNVEAREIWYNDLTLTDGVLIA